MREFKELLKNKHFVFLWTSQILSQVSINVLSLLVITRLFEITGSTIATSLVWIAYALPAIIFGPIGAATADVIDRRKMLMFANLSQGITILFFAFTYSRFVFLSYAVVFMYSLFNQFYVPSEAASVPTYVRKDKLPQANSLFFITQQSALLVGFVLAGLLYDVIGFGVTLLIAAGCLFSAFLIVNLLPKQKPLEHLSHNLEKGFGQFLSEIGEGYRFIRDTSRILFPFLLLIGLQIALSILVVNLPVITSDIIRTRASLSGILIVIPGGVGALSGTFVITKLLNRGWRKRKIIKVALGTLAICLVMIGGVIPLINFWLGRSFSIVVFALAGVSYVCALIPTLTFLQEETPRDKMGRVFGNIWFITTVASVIPVLFSATITDVFGIKLMLVTLGIFAIISVVFINAYEHVFFARKNG
jgi:MFS transporter, DHA3 family, macrolide efflux protein